MAPLQHSAEFNYELSAKHGQRLNSQLGKKRLEEQQSNKTRQGRQNDTTGYCALL